jgi:SdpI/YfhL protein family
VAGQALEVIAGLLVIGGLALAVVGILGWRRLLPRNRFAGVRTVNTLRDDETFTVGNQIGAPLSMAAGAVAVLGGLAVLATPSTAVRLTLIVLAALGGLVLTAVGGVLGDRAAKLVPVPTLGGCSGVCAGCSLVDGCGPDGSGGSDGSDAAGAVTAAGAVSKDTVSADAVSSPDVTSDEPASN